MLHAHVRSIRCNLQYWSLRPQAVYFRNGGSIQRCPQRSVCMLLVGLDTVVGESRSYSIHVVPCCQIIAAVIRNLRLRERDLGAEVGIAGEVGGATAGTLICFKAPTPSGPANVDQACCPAKAVPPASPVPGPNPFIDASDAIRVFAEPSANFPALHCAVAASESEATANSDNGPCL